MPLVCIVDDDLSVRSALARLLESAGYAVASFGSAQDFLDWMPHGRADCIVLDVYLPGMNGLELHERLAAAGDGVPVVFVTAHQDALTRERLARAGGAARLYKPVEGQDLLDAVRAATGAQPDSPGSA